MTKPIRTELAKELANEWQYGMKQADNTTENLEKMVLEAINKAIEPYQQDIEKAEMERDVYKRQVEELHQAVEFEQGCYRHAKTKIQELEAHNALLREALEDTAEALELSRSAESCPTESSQPKGDNCNLPGFHELRRARKTLSKTPTQSLEELKSKEDR